MKDKAELRSMECTFFFFFFDSINIVDFVHVS